MWLLEHFNNNNNNNNLKEAGFLGSGMTIDSLERSLILTASYEEFFQSAKEFLSQRPNGIPAGGRQHICRKHGFDLYGIDDKVEPWAHGFVVSKKKKKKKNCCLV
jgi:hypothetical protein